MSSACAPGSYAKASAPEYADGNPLELIPYSAAKIESDPGLSAEACEGGSYTI